MTLKKMVEKKYEKCHVLLLVWNTYVKLVVLQTMKLTIFFISIVHQNILAK